MYNVNERDDDLWLDWVFIDCFWEYNQTLTNETNKLKYFYENIFAVQSEFVDKLDNDVICNLTSRGIYYKLTDLSK